MKFFFNLFRTLISIPISLLLFVLLILSIILFPLVLKITSPDSFKSWLNDSHLYEKVPDLAVDIFMQKNKATIEGAGMPSDIKSLSKNLISEEELRKSLKELFPPEWLRIQVETNVDGFYTYLNGGPEFQPKMDLVERKSEAQNILSKIFKNKINSLPLCSLSVNVSLEDFDLFNASCWPQNIPKSSAYAMVDSLVSKLPLLEQDWMNIKNSNNQSNEHLERFRKAFQFWPYALMILFIILFILTILIYLLVPSRKGGLFTLGSIFGISGGLVFITGIFIRFNSSFLLEQIANQIPPESVKFLDNAKPFIIILLNDLTGSFIFWSLVVVTFAIIFFILFYSKKVLLPESIK